MVDCGPIKKSISVGSEYIVKPSLLLLESVKPHAVFYLNI